MPFDGVSPDNPKHEPCPYALYPAEREAKARTISLKLLVASPCTGGRIILTFLEIKKTFIGLLAYNLGL